MVHHFYDTQGVRLTHITNIDTPFPLQLISALLHVELDGSYLLNNFDKSAVYTLVQGWIQRGKLIRWQPLPPYSLWKNHLRHTYWYLYIQICWNHIEAGQFDGWFKALFNSKKFSELCTPIHELAPLHNFLDPSLLWCLHSNWHKIPFKLQKQKLHKKNTFQTRSVCRLYSCRHKMLKYISWLDWVVKVMQHCDSLSLRFTKRHN